MLKTENLNLKLANKTIINNVSFSVKKGEFVALIGANGSGKSSIVKTISRLVSKTTGTITVGGKTSKSYNKREYAKILATMAQHNKAIEELTVWDMISYGRTPYKSIFTPLNDKDLEIINHAILITNLMSLKDRSVVTLSGGELQRVHLASCLAQTPDILILDEPTNHLDILHQFKFLSLVKDLVKKEKLTVICVLHDVNQAIKYGDKIVALKNGNLLYQGTPKEVINEKMIFDIFGINAKIYQNDSGMYVDFIYNI